MSKAAGPDNIPGSVLRTRANQLVDVVTDIFNISLSQEIVPTCFKTIVTIVPVPKTSAVSSLNDYRPVDLTLILMKCFEKLVLQHIKFAFRTNRSTEDAISPLPSTQSSPTLRRTAPTSVCCLLISAQHSTQSPP